MLTMKGFFSSKQKKDYHALQYKARNDTKNVGEEKSNDEEGDSLGIYQPVGYNQGSLEETAMAAMTITTEPSSPNTKPAAAIHR